MRIEGFTLEESSGAVRGVSNARQTWSRRGGLRLQLHSGGHRGVGEASPLSGYSPDTLEQTRQALERWRPEKVEPDLEGVRSAIEQIPETVPAARFAAETALLDLLGQQRDEPIFQLLGGRARRLQVAALLDLDLEQPQTTSRQAGQLLDAGFRHLKVKVGRPHREDDELRLLELLRREHGGSWQLRLDANGCLPASEVASRLERLAEFSPEFLEEPLAWPDLEQLDAAPMPIAVDESLRQGLDSHGLGLDSQGLGLDSQSLGPFETWLRHGPCTVVVLKPLILGGVLRCLELARHAGALGLVAVASHGFDGPIALQATTALALALDAGSTPVAHGLARHTGLDAWPEIGGLWVEGPSVDASAAGPGLGVKR